MENELKSNTCVEKVKSIKIGKETMKLLECRAMMSDVFNGVIDVFLEHYGEACDDMTEKFRKKHCELDEELMKLTMMIIDENSLNSDYEEI